MINQCTPGKIIFEIYSLFGNCRKNVEKVEVQIKNANFTTSIQYKTFSPNINVTNIYKVDKYVSYIYKYEKIKDENCNAFDTMCCQNYQEEDNPERNISYKNTWNKPFILDITNLF